MGKLVVTLLESYDPYVLAKFRTKHANKNYLNDSNE